MLTKKATRQDRRAGKSRLAHQTGHDGGESRLQDNTPGYRSGKKPGEVIDSVIFHASRPVLDVMSDRRIAPS
jgi:hypothetical protein